MITFYLKTLNNLPLAELLNVLNDKSNKHRLVRTLVTSSIIVHNYLKFYSREFYSVDLALSTTLSVVQSSMISTEPCTMSDIDKLVKMELNILSNITYNGVSNYEVETSYTTDPLMNAFIKAAKLEILDITPPHLKLAMVVFITTRDNITHGYSDLDRYLFDTILCTSGYTPESVITMDFYESLETVTEKSLFLYLLSVKHPEIFIILSSVKDINSLILLAEYKSMRLPPAPDLIVILDNIAKLAKELPTNSTSISSSDHKLFAKIANNIVFDLTDAKILDLLSRSVDRVYEEFDKTLDNVVKRANNSGSIMQLANLLHSEVNKQINIVARIKSLT